MAAFGRRKRSAARFILVMPPARFQIIVPPESGWMPTDFPRASRARARPAARGAIMSGKIAAACAFGFVSLLLTLIAFKIGFQFAPGLGGKADVSLLAIAKLLLVLTPVLLFGSCLLTLISASVKSVKEAQSYMSVLMLLPLIPTMALLVHPVKNQLWMFTVPFLGANQMIMKVLRGEGTTAVEWAVVLGAGLVLAAIFWGITARLYHREQLAISG